MLTHLAIKNFTIIDNLEIDFAPGMTVLTGETGAGKSIVIDTLELALGARADSQTIRPNCDRCDLTAIFDITKTPAAQTWLQEHDLDTDNDCIIRRSITADGRSKTNINGIICTQQQARELGSLLVNIHGQHEHQSLLKRDIQLELLDNFGNNVGLCNEVKLVFEQWQELNNKIQQLQQLAGNSDSQTELLNYQLNELEELDLQEDELEQLHQEHKQLSNAGELLQNCQAALELLDANNLASAQNQLEPIQHFDPKLTTANELINTAIIQTDEATAELRHYLDTADLDPERLQQVEQRLEKIYDLARKHHIQPEELFNLYQNLSNQLEKINSASEELTQAQQNITKHAEQYTNLAAKLSAARQKAATALTQAIEKQMQQLNMANGKFAVQFTPTKDNKFTATGLEQAEFQISLNPGQPLQPLNKVASGGELSRISLAIQVTTAANYTIPCLIFDEVDVGIGGKTAAIVGNLLKTLGNNAQVICVTHLPQVAAQGQQHIKVSKQAEANTTTVTLSNLNQPERVNEIARMLGGIEITASTLAHAEEMLS